LKIETGNHGFGHFAKVAIFTMSAIAVVLITTVFFKKAKGKAAAEGAFQELMNTLR
jgi:hypothetical protein